MVSSISISESAHERYKVAMWSLASRCLGEPYNFHLVAKYMHPGLLDSNIKAAKIISACMELHKLGNSYTPQRVALDCAITTDYALKLAATDIEMTLPDAMDSFIHYHGQWAEIIISNTVESYVHQGLTSEEIQVAISKARKEMGLAARMASVDGKDEFEKKLLAAIDGIQYTYPITPYLKAMRDVVPYYEPGDYIVVAALTGQGKTYDVLNQILHNSILGIPSCYINLENTPSNVQKRIWQMHSKKVFKADLRDTDDNMQYYLNKWDEVKKMPFHSYNPGRSLEAIVSTIRQAWYEHSIKFAAIDYAQLIRINGYRGARNYELGEISGTLRALALELQIPIYVLAQLKQEVSKTNDKRGGMYDIKDCADFSQDATIVKILYRPSYFDIEKYELPGGGFEIYPEKYADHFLAKGRETGPELVKCRFDHIQGFYDAVDQPFSPYKNNYLPKLERPSNFDDIPF